MNICIYGASSDEIAPVYPEEVERAAQALAKEGHTLVFGGGRTGLMGAAARGFYRENGKIIGIAPRFFDEPGILFEHCTEMIYTDTMRRRKELMEERADAFVAVPGGVGTLDEFFEIFTLRTLCRHQKPVILFNAGGYYDTLLRFFDEMLEKGFISPAVRALVFSAETPEALLQLLRGEKETDRGDS